MIASNLTLKELRETLFKAIKLGGRTPPSVRLIGISKKHPYEKILHLAREGLLDFGENYVQEWKEKREKILTYSPELAPKIHWHFVGHLQSNKARDVVGQVDYIHTIDSVKLANKVSQCAEKLGLIQKVLLEVNLAGEKSKYGFCPNDVLNHLEGLASLPNLALEGLMAIPPPVSPIEKVRPFFSQLKSLLDECNQSRVLVRPMQELSMGMSQDYQIAISEGATMIRLGTALFGPRRET